MQLMQQYWDFSLAIAHKTDHVGLTGLLKCYQKVDKTIFPQDWVSCGTSENFWGFNSQTLSVPWATVLLLLFALKAILVHHSFRMAPWSYCLWKIVSWPADIQCSLCGLQRNKLYNIIKSNIKISHLLRIVLFLNCSFCTDWLYLLCFLHSLGKIGVCWLHTNLICLLEILSDVVLLALHVYASTCYAETGIYKHSTRLRNSGLWTCVMAWYYTPSN